MARRNQIQEAFLSYRSAVIPKDAPDVQISECRRAFYAGALSAYTLCRDLPDPESAAMKVLSDLDDELREFPERVKRRLA